MDGTGEHKKMGKNKKLKWKVEKRRENIEIILFEDLKTSECFK